MKQRGLNENIAIDTSAEGSTRSAFLLLSAVLLLLLVHWGPQLDIVLVESSQFRSICQRVSQQASSRASKQTNKQTKKIR